MVCGCAGAVVAADAGRTMLGRADAGFHAARAMQGRMLGEKRKVAESADRRMTRRTPFQTLGGFDGRSGCAFGVSDGFAAAIVNVAVGRRLVTCFAKHA